VNLPEDTVIEVRARCNAMAIMDRVTIPQALIVAPLLLWTSWQIFRQLTSMLSLHDQEPGANKR
jgi:hypothetical protein